MRVLVDATALPEQRRGVGRYVDELVAALPGHGVEVHVATQPRDRGVYEPLVGHDRVHDAPGWAQHPAARLAWEQTGLPALVARVRPDVVHSPHYTMPLLRLPLRLPAGAARPARVVTLHDATFFSDPELHSGVKAQFFAGWTRLSTARADALVVPSAATRDAVVERTHADPARLAVVPHGVDHDRFRSPTDAEVREVREWLGLADETPYVAFLGTMEPRKNVPALVEAFVAVAAGRSTPPVLVLAGGSGWDETIDAAVAAVPASVRVLRPGFVPDGLVPALLGGAQVVAYPALGEGFGLPVLEAMACGAAVLTTRRLSLPEVGGDAVAYAATPDAGDIATALAALLDDPARREALGHAGLERAAGYTWDAAAAGHARVYALAVEAAAATGSAPKEEHR